MDFCDEEHELNHELGSIGDDSHQKHFIASSTQPILNCSDQIIQPVSYTHLTLPTKLEV